LASSSFLRVFILPDFVAVEDEVCRTFPITFSYVRQSKFAKIIEIKMGVDFLRSNKEQITML
jgi:hypothetical protein